MFSGMGGGMGEAFNAAMDGDDEPMPQAKPTPVTEKKTATVDPLSGLNDQQRAAVAEKEAGNDTYYTNKAGRF